MNIEKIIKEISKSFNYPANEKYKEVIDFLYFNWEKPKFIKNKSKQYISEIKIKYLKKLLEEIKNNYKDIYDKILNIINNEKIINKKDLKQNLNDIIENSNNIDIIVDSLLYDKQLNILKPNLKEAIFFSDANLLKIYKILSNTLNRKYKEKVNILDLERIKLALKKQLSLDEQKINFILNKFCLYSKFLCVEENKKIILNKERRKYNKGIKKAIIEYLDNIKNKKYFKFIDIKKFLIEEKGYNIKYWGYTNKILNQLIKTKEYNKKIKKIDFNLYVIKNNENNK